MEPNNTQSIADAEPNVEEEIVVDYDTTDTVRMHPVANGEYKVQVTSAGGKKGVSQKTGRKWMAFNLQLDIPEEPEADFFYHMQFLPTEDMDEKSRRRALSDLADFKEAFGLDHGSPVRAHDLVGKEAYAHVGVDDDPKYGMRNIIKGWITGPDKSSVPGM